MVASLAVEQSDMYQWPWYQWEILQMYDVVQTLAGIPSHMVIVSIVITVILI